MTQAQNQSIEILTTVGRVVSGHPMVANTVTDPTTKQAKLGHDGQPQLEYYLGLAIPKQGETDWKTTSWGVLVMQAARAGWPNGEYQRPDFAWKVTDGDSAIPNKAGRKPCEREGWPGHWVLHLSTGIPIRCYHVGKYDPTQQIQNKDEIKAGDYGRVLINCKANNPSQSPGVYLNPVMFELSRAGQQIVLEGGPAAADVFGAAAPQVPANAQVDTGVASQQQQPQQGAQTQVQPDPGFLNGPAPAPPATDTPAPPAQPVMRVYNGQNFTEDALRAAKWTEQQIQSLPLAQ